MSGTAWLSLGPCRYRCLVALKHSLPVSGDACVSVLSRLCTVTPNMYRVGISKVSPAPHSALEAPSQGLQNWRRDAEMSQRPPG